MLADEKDAEVEATVSTNDTNVDPTLQADSNATIEPSNSENDEEFDEQNRIPFDENLIEKYKKIRSCRAVLNQILLFVHVLSRYLETYYRYDDELAVDPNFSVTMKTSVYFDWLLKLHTNVSNALLSSTLPPSAMFKQGMDSLLANIRAVPVHIPTENLNQESQQFADWVMVNSGDITLYSETDGGTIDESTPPLDYTNLNLPLFRPFCTPGCHSMTIEQFRNSNLYCMNAWHDRRFDLTQTVNVTHKLEREIHDGEWLQARALVDQNSSYLHPSSLNPVNVPAMLTTKVISLLPPARRENDPLYPRNVVGAFGHSSTPAARKSSSSASATASSSSNYQPNLTTPIRSSQGGNYTNTPGGVFANTSSGGGYINTSVGGTYINTSLGGGYPTAPGSVNKNGPHSSTTGMSSVILTTDLPKLQQLTATDLAVFIESCQRKSLTGDAMISQIDTDIQYLIGTKLEINPMPGFTSQADIEDWQARIPIVPLLLHLKSTATHGSQSNDAIVQAALNNIRFNIDINNETSIDQQIIQINKTLITGMQSDIQIDVSLQKIMKDALIANLQRSNPKPFCTDIANHLKGLGSKVYDVKSFNREFNSKACEIIRAVAMTDRYRDPKHALNITNVQERSNKKHKGFHDCQQQQPLIHQTESSARVHCNGCGKNHKGACRFSY